MQRLLPRNLGRMTSGTDRALGSRPCLVGLAEERHGGSTVAMRNEYTLDLDLG